MMTAKIDKNKLIAALKNELMSQKTLALKAHITPYFLSRISSNNFKYKASADTCKSILKALGGDYEFEDIFFWVD